jgi:hypothetical protein
VPVLGVNRTAFHNWERRTGDVFVADTHNNRVVELPAGGSQQTLPFSGLDAPYGVAVDLAGDVFVADTFNRRVVQLSPSLTTGSFVLSPGSGPAGSSIGLASVTPCKLGSGGAFAASEASCFCIRRRASFWKSRP